MKNISIAKKLFGLLLISIIGLLILLFEMNSSLDNLKLMEESKQNITVLKAQMLMLRRAEKDFLLRKDLKYKKKFEAGVKTINKKADELIVQLNRLEIETNGVEKFKSIIKEYKTIFNILITKQKEIGLDPKSGLYGELRKSVQTVQSLLKNSSDKEILLMVLDLRKHEKDFMLRKDLKYIQKFEKRFNNLEQYLKLKIDIEGNLKNKIISKLDSYKSNFLLLVKAEKELGLNSKLGFQKNMRSTIHKTETLLEKLSLSLDEMFLKKSKTKSIERYLTVSLIIVFVTLFTLFIIRQITSSLKDFQSGLLGFFKYLNKEVKEVTPLKATTQDEIGEMSTVVNENINKTKKLLEEDIALIDEVKEVVNKVKAGNIKQEIKKTTSNESLEELKTIFNEMLENITTNVCGDINKIQTALQKFQELDFSHRIPGWLGNTSKGLNGLAEIINEMLVENKSNGLTLQNSSNVLMSNVDKLSSASNEAAASLEETAAALEEITSNIISNSENVTQMSRYANELTMSANDGHNLANQTTKAMDDIDEEVNAINEAITIIDQIAFQTNILSSTAAFKDRIFVWKPLPLLIKLPSKQIFYL